MSQHIQHLSHVRDLIQTCERTGVTLHHAERTLLQAYAEGRISAIDMLAHARQFATAAEYQDWLLQNRCHSRCASHAQVLTEMQAFIVRKHYATSSSLN